MAPDRMGGPAYWASGGTVAGRRGPIELARAAELLGFFNQQAEACLADGEPAASVLCAELALELGRAIARTLAWLKCGSAEPPHSSRVR